MVRIRVDPLNLRTPLVDPKTGTPSPQFMRLWQNLFGNDAANSDSILTLEDVINDLRNNKIVAADGTIVVTGTGSLLDGDVPLAADVQALLDKISATEGAILYRDASAWSALAPGSDTQVLTLNSGLPSWQNASGGGGGGINATFYPSGSGTTIKSFSALGNVIKPQLAMSLTGLGMQMTTITGGVYKLAIAPYNTSTNKITAAPAYASGSYTEASGAAGKHFFLKFSSAFAMTAGSAYVVFVVRTDSTTTVSQTAGSFTSNQYSPAVEILTASGTAVQLASLAPSTSDTWTVNGSGIWLVVMTYSL